MDRIEFIGNLTKDPELRTTQTGINVCSFSVAVNKPLSKAQRDAGQQAQAKFYRVTAWRELGENCAKYLAKGRKVYICGTVDVSTYTGNDGQVHANLEVTANEVEFLTPREGQGAGQAPAQGYASPSAAPAPVYAQAPQGYAPQPGYSAQPAPQYAQQQMAYAPQNAPYPAAAPAAPAGFTAVETDDLPF
jgi:single-strand DNA-binding protein